MPINLNNKVVMADKIESEEGTLDWAKWAAVALIIAAAVYGNSYFSAESLLIRTLGLLVVAGAAGWLASQTVKGKAFVTLCLDARVKSERWFGQRGRKLRRQQSSSSSSFSLWR